MAYLLLLVGALACDLPSLPPLIDYFSSKSYEHLEGSGKFLLDQETSWYIEIVEISWFRLTLEPKFATIELSLSENLSTIAESSSGDQGYASLAKKLPPGRYELHISSNEIASSSPNLQSCQVAHCYLNIGLHPYANLQELRIPNLPNGYPDLSGINEIIGYNSPYSSTFSSYTVLTSTLLDPVLISYPIIIPEIRKDLRGNGATGLWDLTFSLRNY